MRMNLRTCGEGLLVLALIAFGRISYAVTINFDDVSDGTMIDSQYTGQGVAFSSVVSATGHAYAVDEIIYFDLEPNGVSLNTGLFFDARDGAVKAAFSTSQSSVSIDARPILPPEYAGTPLNKPFLEAFDSSDNFLGEVLYPLNFGDPGYTGDSGIWETLTVTSASDNIAYVLFSSQHPAGSVPVYGEFDNLAFGGGAPPGPGGTPIPEPMTMTLLGMAIGALALRRVTRRRA